MKAVLILLSLTTAVSLVAQSSPEALAQSEALKLRTSLADAISQGSEKSESVLTRLKGAQSHTGLKLEATTDFAYAAIDIGRRLLSVGKPAEAEKFFVEAEAALARVLAKAPESAKLDRVQYLQVLATIRSQYLNKSDQAKKDLDEAILINPKDKYLQSARDSLVKDKADHFKGKKLPTKEGQ